MRKVTAGLFSSIDGVVEAPDQWQPAFDEEMGAALSRMLDEQDAVLQYLRRCRAVNDSYGDILDQWIARLNEGLIPELGFPFID